MRVGTKSVLFGAHQFLIHPWFVAWGWWTLYGFPWDPRLWAAFFVHDLGYLGKPNMDGAEGETHPEFGAWIMARLFDGGYRPERGIYLYGQWGWFALLHSRYYAKKMGVAPSRLCVADKLALVLTPAWLYLPMVRATGEIAEYMSQAEQLATENMTDAERRQTASASQAVWFAGVQSYLRRWVEAHKDDQTDTWTSDARTKATKSGVWQ